MSDTRELASQLPDLDDERLAALIARVPRQRGRLADFFELAEALLAPDTIRQALARAPRALVAAIAEGEATSPLVGEFARLHPDDALILFREDLSARGPVTVYLGSDAAYAIRDRLSLEEPDRAADGDGVSRATAEHALHAVLALAEVLERDHGIPVTSRGALPLSEAQRIAEVVPIDADSVSDLVAVAEEAGLARPGAGRLRLTEAGESWLRASTRERWSGLLVLWWSCQPDQLRTVVGSRPHIEWGDDLAAALAWAFPAAEAEQSGSDRRGRVAVTLGALADGRPTDAGLALFTGAADELAGIATAMLPEDVDSAFVQHDMTVIAPGPLVFEAEALLHRVAETEQRSYAARYRISEASLRRAVRGGLPAERIGASLRELSAAPLPQPLEYLLDQLGGQTGAGTERAGIPAVPLRSALDSGARASISRIRAASQDTDALWLERQLREAAQSRSELLVTVRMPDGSESEYALQPRAVASGRLRALDARADVERTLPVSLIVGIRSLP